MIDVRVQECPETLPSTELTARAMLFTSGDTLLMAEAARVYTACLQKQLRHIDLQPETWELLEAVSVTPCIQTELAKRLGVQKGTLSRWIVALEQRGLIDRRSRQKDLRIQTVHITDYGNEQLQLARQRIGAALLPFGECLSGVERILADKICRRLIHSVTERVSDHLR